MAKVVIGATLQADSKQATQSVGSFRTELKKAQQEVISLSEKFGPLDSRVVSAAKKAAELRDRIGDAQNMIKAFNPDAKFAAFGQSVQGVVGGFTALQGVMGLVGVQGEEVNKMLLKVQSALAISQGLDALKESVDSFKTLGGMIQRSTLFVKANELANKGAAMAMKLFGGAVDTTSSSFKFLKGAIAATGIGILILAISEAISFFDDLFNSAERAAEAEKNALEMKQKYAEVGLKGEEAYMAREEKIETAKAKAAGKNDKEVYDIHLKWQNQRLGSLKRYIAEVGDDSDKSIEAQTRIKDLEADIETDKYNFQEAQNKKRLDAQKRANEKWSEERKKQLEKDKAYQKDLSDTNKDSRVSHVGEFDDPQEEIRQANIAKEKAALDISVKNVDESVKAKIDAQVRQTESEDLNKEARIKIAAEEAAAKKDFYHDIGDAAGALADVIGKQTAVGKGLAVAQAAINTWQGATEVLRAKSVLPEPMATISKVLNFATVVATGYKAIKEILKVKVGGSGGGGGGGVSTSAPLTPQIGIQGTQLQGISNTINNQGNQAIRAFVVETDVTNNQERIRRINRAAKISG